VKPPVENTVEHVLDVTIYVPLRVFGGLPETLTVPANSPVHDGCDGRPPDPNVIVYANVVSVNRPLNDAFNNTVPLGSATTTGPVTIEPVCTNVHVMRGV
jgi:hypothetical protein